MCVCKYVYISLADFNHDELEEENDTGQSMLFMFTSDLYICVGAGESFFSICKYLCVWPCVCVCVHIIRNMHSALLLSGPGHVEPGQPHSYGGSG